MAYETTQFAVYGFFETLLKDSNDQKFWELNTEQKDRSKTLRFHRKFGTKTKRGGVMLIIPQILNPKSLHEQKSI